MTEESHATDGSDGRHLTERSIDGALWFLLQTVVIKASGVITQVALAYLLVPEDFGAIGLALSVTALADVLHQSGLAQVVVQRGEELEDRGSSVFWLSVFMGLGAMAVLMVAAPLLERLFDAPDVAVLVVVIALAVPINAANVVPRAKLIADLAFSKIAAISGLQVLLVGILSVVGAAVGLGSLSFAIPVPIAALVALIWYRRSSPLGLSWPPSTDSWRPLFRSSLVLITTSWLAKIVDYGDYFLLGVFTDPATVGLYFFAFRLSAQSATIVAHNVGRVMFPALVQVPSGSERQYRAFTRGTRALAGIGVPIAVVMVFFGRDLVYAVFDSEWNDSAFFVQVLSVAATVKVVSESHTHLLRAQGRYAEMLRWNLVGTTSFLIVVAAAGAFAGAWGVSLAVVSHTLVDGWVRYHLTTRVFGSGLREFPVIVAGPALTAVVIAGVSFAAAQWGFGLVEPSWQRLALGLAGVAALYFPVLRHIDPETSGVLSSVFRHAAAPIRRRVARRSATEEGSP